MAALESSVCTIELRFGSHGFSGRSKEIDLDGFTRLDFDSDDATVLKMPARTPLHRDRVWNPDFQGVSP